MNTKWLIGYLIMSCVFAILTLTSCTTTATLDIKVRKTRPVKFYYDYGTSEEDNLRKALLYIWLLENYTDLLEGAVWK
ncbi:hypothetical protein [Borrelia sp. RT1S]|uniref:hypothetical protein n=1 Tax=Borrelia sp. RT1S TaxID=2898580 RepID=UPI001E4B4B93|nr:hypothetical protein [Borrelia sp. RT1S]UGQ17711.1 hypothetical protein LSO05_04610 [Borrelia sp. RT1S]UGQ17802.1 hypothetical protein LSO05_05070 [Borrelia sp. RT1S]UGQ17829.1 hypothetical protein LSO05_05205 [Borrelia sp. RT1S]